MYLLLCIGAAGAIASVVHDGFMNPIEGKMQYVVYSLGGKRNLSSCLFITRNDLARSF